MTIGIIPNISKENITDVLFSFLDKLLENNLKYFVSDSILKLESNRSDLLSSFHLLDHEKLCEQSDMIVSIGGDGTMLNTAYEARHSNPPMLGLNFGKLGFLAEFDMHKMDELIADLKNGNYFIEERMALNATCCDDGGKELYAINDIVIDRGKWPKMIELTMKVDDDYVSTFSADGIIIATPTGSTGYSLSTGGPIVSPKADAITLSPISPHTLTMRPLVVSSKQEISIEAISLQTSIQINCDGQRVYHFEPPVVVKINKSSNPVKLVHTHSTNYFEILRKKLYWGLDIRTNSNDNRELK